MTDYKVTKTKAGKYKVTFKIDYLKSKEKEFDTKSAAEHYGHAVCVNSMYSLD